MDPYTLTTLDYVAISIPVVVIVIGLVIGLVAELWEEYR